MEACISLSRGPRPQARAVGIIENDHHYMHVLMSRVCVHASVCVVYVCVHTGKVWYTAFGEPLGEVIPSKSPPCPPRTH